MRGRVTAGWQLDIGQTRVYGAERVKIGLVILHADPARGGAERYTHDLAAGLRDREHAVTLLASSFAQVPERVERVLIDARGMTRAGRYVGFLDSLDEHLRQRDYDVVHAMLPVRRCDVYHPHAGVAAEALESGHLKHRGGMAQVVAKQLNRLNARRRRFAAVERELLERPNPPIVLCLSDYVKAAVRKHYTIAEERLEKLFNGIDLVRFDARRRPEARKEVREKHGIAALQVVGLMIAQDFERKGLQEAIEALGKVDPRVVLVVVGREDPSYYQIVAREQGVEARVKFAGATADPHAYYQASDFFVLPTRHDPCSLVVLEALVMGVPVISTKQNGACEAMTQGVHGFVLENPADIAALAGAMRVMLDDKVRSWMRESCLGLRESLSQAQHVARLEAIYDRLRRQGRGMRPPTAS